MNKHINQQLLDASLIQKKVREYRSELNKKYIESTKLTKKEEEIRRDIIEIGLETMEYALSDFTLKVAQELKVVKIKLSVYGSIAIAVGGFVAPYLYSFVDKMLSNG
tara:strand:- start:89 stop:409 length:321 start_codon:yes stop_codon:yes gene_type:complete